MHRPLLTLLLVWFAVKAASVLPAIAKPPSTSHKASPAKSVTALARSGQTTFQFGASIPTVVCAPLHVCDLRLETGETITQVNGGDAVRWKISSAISGTGPKSQAHLLIKPTEANLDSNLVITTDRRTYSIKLVSRQNDWMPIIAFTYPPQNVPQTTDTTSPATLPTLRQPSAGSQKLDFGYRVSGPRVAWRPLKVYTDGVKTYLRFPSTMQHGEAPVLVALDTKEKPLLVNYRVQQDVYVVDKVLDRAALVQGVGRSQKKILIQRRSVTP